MNTRLPVFAAALLALLASSSFAAEITINPPPVTLPPVNVPAMKITVPTVKGDKGDRGDKGASADLAPLIARLNKIEADIATLKAGASISPVVPPIVKPPVVVSPAASLPPPIVSPYCTAAAVIGSAVRPAPTVDPASPATWPKVEITVGPTGRCSRIAQAFSTLADLGPLDVTVTLDPSVEYVDDTSSHFREAPGRPMDWPPFEQTIRWKTLIRSKPGSGKLAVLRSNPASLYYGKGILNLQPDWNGADITLQGLRFIGVKSGDVDGRLTGIWIEPSDKRATITFRDVEMSDADTCILNGGPNHSIVLERVYVHDCGSGSGLTHNIYIGRVASLTVRDLLSTGVKAGHLFKSRAAVNDLSNVRLLDGPTGSDSYALDFPNGGVATVRNLVTHKGVQASNGPSLAYGEEGTANGGQWATRSLTITGWTALGQVRDGTAFQGAFGIWNASDTDGARIEPSITGLSVFGIPEGNMMRIKDGNRPIAGAMRLPAMPALDMASPVRLP